VQEYFLSIGSYFNVGNLYLEHPVYFDADYLAL
jgi:hypothetical protein